MSYPIHEDGMTVEQAVERLQVLASRSRRVQRLCVPYDPGFMTVGGTPAKLVRAIYPGIDWDASKMFVDLGERLKAPSDEQEKLRQELHRATNALGFVALALSSALPADAKLKAIKQTMDGYMKPPGKPTKV
jgi:hypothetical protein